MDDLKKNIENILNQFAQEELGNRLSQFALLSLKSIIIDAINKLKTDDGKENI